MLDRFHWLPIASGIDLKIDTWTYKVVHLKQPLSLAKHLKLKFMHFTTRNNDQLLFKILQLVLTVMDVVLSATRRPQFGIKFQTIHTAPSVNWTGILLGYDTTRYLRIFNITFMRMTPKFYFIQHIQSLQQN